MTAFSGLVGLDAQHREIGLGVAADDLGLEPRAVGEDDGDLVGVRDHVVVGDHDAGGVDDEAGAERVDAARRAVGRLVVAALAAAVLEELLEELLERRARRKLRHGLLAAALPPPRASTFCEVEMLTTASITFSATSAMFSGPRANAGVASVGQREHGGGNRGQCRLPDGMRENGEQAGHGRQFS